MKKLLIGCLVIGLIIGFFILYKYHFRAVVLKYQLIQSETYTDKISQHKAIKMNEEAIVLLGNSLTQDFPTHDFNNPNIINLGVGGDLTTSMQERIFVLETIKPKKIFLMAGINDLIANLDVQRVTNDYEILIEGIFRYAPNAELYVQSCLPTSFEDGLFADNEKTNKNVIALNNKLTELANTKNFKFMNLHPLFLDASILNEKLTYDGLHLNENGYKIWKAELEKLF